MSRHKKSRRSPNKAISHMELQEVVSEPKMSCNKEMVEWIEALNTLQDKLVSMGEPNLVTHLPQIAVIGSQSAGKSSVLESFVGRDFLPRGQDIVTRRPLILQLKQNKKDDRIFAKFNHSDKEFTDFGEIRREIEEETERTVPEYMISAEPINLMITSPDVLDLNLIDLPGITKNPVGNQPGNIEEIVKNLVNSFIKRDNCLILAVTPANQDLSTSDAIQLAREADPEGMRTIGVLTKLDLMDKGRDARNILMNSHQIRLKKGFIGVINRSQEDIEKNKSLVEAMANEKKFFETHEKYRDICHKLGIETLQKFLQKELSEHLTQELPALQHKFKHELTEIEEKINGMDSEVKNMTPNELISKTSETFKHEFRNELGTGDDVRGDRLIGATDINRQITVQYQEDLEQINRDFDEIKSKIMIAIQNGYGIQVELFVPNKVYKNVVCDQIELMRKPSLACVDRVHEELENIVNNCAESIDDYPKIKDIYLTEVLKMLEKFKNTCKDMVNHRLDAEKAYLNIAQEDFTKAIQAERRKSSQSVFSFSNMMFGERKGWITWNGCKYFFTLECQTLSWSTVEHNPTYKDSLNLKDVQLIVDKKCISLKRNFDSIVMNLVFDSKESALEWTSALMDNIYDDSDFKSITQDITTSSDTMKRHTSPDRADGHKSKKVRYDKYAVPIDTQANAVTKLVLAYIKIVEKIMRDTLPKYIKKEMTDSLEKYIRSNLRDETQKQNLPMNDLIDIDPIYEELKELETRKVVFEEIIDTMTQLLSKTGKSVRTLSRKAKS